MGRKGTRFGTGSGGAAMLQQALCCDAAGGLALLRAQPGPAPRAPLRTGAISRSLSLPGVFRRIKKLNRAEMG